MNLNNVGKTWSFLAEDEQTCSLWVESLNRSIQVAMEHSREMARTSNEETTLLRSPPGFDKAHNYNDRTMDHANNVVDTSQEPDYDKALSVIKGLV